MRKKIRKTATDELIDSILNSPKAEAEPTPSPTSPPVLDPLNSLPDSTEQQKRLTREVIISTGYDTTDFLANRVKKLNCLMEKIPPNTYVSSLDEEDLFAILEEASKIAMTIRNEYVGGKDAFYPGRRERFIEHDAIEAFVDDDFILKLLLPPLFGRQFKGSYDIYWRVKLVLEDLTTRHQFPQFTDEKLLLIYKKYSPNLSGKSTCDNDNWEAGRVTNAICEALNYSDNSDHFSMMYTSVTSEFSGTEALVIPLSSLGAFTAYLQEPMPRQQSPKNHLTNNI